jgi:AcrR family transcriptional regulator
MAPNTSRDEQREQTRRRVYEAALTIFRRDGVSACRIDDIATLAQISRGAFYFHFPTKEDVLVARLRQAEQESASAISAMPADAGIAAVLSGAASALAAPWQEDRTLLPEVAVVALKQAAVYVSDPESEPVRVALTPYFRAAAERGEIRHELPAEVLVAFYLTNVLAAMLGWCAMPELPLATVLGGVNDLFLHGVLAEAPKSASPPKPKEKPR